MLYGALANRHADPVDLSRIEAAADRSVAASRHGAGLEFFKNQVGAKEPQE